MMKPFLKSLLFFNLILSVIDAPYCSEDTTSVQNEPKKPRGSSISLPLDEPQVRESPPRKSSLMVQDSRQVVLVIEDDLVTQCLFKRQFEGYRKDFEKYNLIFTATGEEGIELHKLYQPYLTFVDFNLAKTMNGIEVITTIKENYTQIFWGDKTSNKIPLPWVFVAFSSEEENNKEMMKVGATFAIPKLLKPLLFREILDQVLYSDEL